MHESVHGWIGKMVGQYGLDQPNLKVLELGSRNVNGSIRWLFNRDYIGLDMQEGDDVDIIASANDIPFPDDTFHVVVTCEMLEHDPHPHQSMAEAARVLQPGGVLLLTTRGTGFPFHCPPDYWRFTNMAIELLLKDAGFNQWGVYEDPQCPGVFALAQMAVADETA